MRKYLLLLTILSLEFFIFTKGITEPNSFLVKYAMTKARESCVGEKLTRIWEKQIHHVVEECRFPDGVPHDYHPPQGYSPPGHPLPYGPEYFGRNIPLGFIPDHVISIGSSEIGFNGYAVAAGPHRRKRSTSSLDSASGGKMFINSLVHGEKRILDQISNVTCILRNLRVIGPDGKLQIHELAKAAAQMPIEAYLKKDLLEGLNQCTNFVSCLPPSNKPPGLVPWELKQAYAFIRCSQLKRQEACVKKDIRKNIDKNFPHEVKGSINLDSFAQRMLEVLMAEDVMEYETLLL
ncbi:UNVERIFIED_CONTAM: hypothetical protein RMT77_008119 [Armadillidium vulgare]